MSEPQQRRLKSRIEQGVLVVTITEPYLLSDSAANKLRGELLDTAIRPGARKIVLDFQCVNLFSSTGFGVLFSFLRKLRETDGQLVLCGLSPELLRVFEITRLRTLFRVQSDVPAAINDLNSSSPALSEGIEQKQQDEDEREQHFMRSFDALVTITRDMFCIVGFDGFYRLALLAHNQGVPCALLTNWRDLLNAEKGLTLEGLRRAFHAEEVFGKEDLSECVSWIKETMARRA